MKATHSSSLPISSALGLEDHPAAADRIYTVLLVEDDSAVRALFETSLSLEGYKILTADRASVAVLKALHFHPDVVVTDIVLPGADGCDLAVALKRLPGTDHIPIVAVTGAAEPSMRAKIASVRFDRVLQKPCAPERVTEAVHALLEPPLSAD